MKVTAATAKPYMVGIDLGRETCQVSWVSRSQKRTMTGRRIGYEPETYTRTPGRELCDIPVCMLRERETGRWLCGEEALRCASQTGQALTRGFYEAALEGRMLAAGGEEVNPSMLLSLYFRSCLQLIRRQVSPDQVDTLCVCVPVMEPGTEEVLRRALERLELPVRGLVFKDHAGAFFDYVMNQNEEMRRKGALLLEYRGGEVLTLGSLDVNHRTNPVTAFASFETRPFRRQASPAEKDAALLGILREAGIQDRYAAAFLIGDGFAGRWMQESLRFLGQGRRLFQGNSLFSRGAALSALYASGAFAPGDGIFFLSGGSLTFNVGLTAFSGGKETYVPLLDAGTPWYEARAEEEFILGEGTGLDLALTPVDGSPGRILRLELEDLPERPPRTTRIRLTLSMPEAGTLTAEAEDLGFGTIFPASGRIWKESMKL